jgi:hypothetical protein
MRKGVKFTAIALLTGLGSAALLAQVAPSTRPAPIRIGATPGVANTAGGDGRTAAQIVELQGQIDTLKAELATQKNQIVTLQNGLKTTATKGFEMAGQLSKLNQDYPGHNHFINTTNVSMAHDPDGRNVIRIYSGNTSTPTHGCTEIPNFQSAGKWKMQENQNWRFQWNCVYPNGMGEKP